jgi:hypothetical protein
MRVKTLLALSVAAAFAAPLAVYGQGDKPKSEAGATPSTSQGASGASGTTGSAASGAGKSGAQAMFENMDKDRDGFVTLEEAKGTPHEKDFATLDKNGDRKLSPEEHAAAPEHAGEKAGAGGTAGGTGGTTGGGAAQSGSGTSGSQGAAPAAPGGSGSSGSSSGDKKY